MDKNPSYIVKIDNDEFTETFNWKGGGTLETGAFIDVPLPRPGNMILTPEELRATARAFAAKLMAQAEPEKEVETCANCGHDRFSEIVIKDSIRLEKGCVPSTNWQRAYADRGAVQFIYRCSRCGKNL